VLETRNLSVAIKNIARGCGDEISDVQPLLDARLEDGARVAAMFPPCAVGGPALTIRKFTRRYRLDDLVGVGTLTAAMAGHLAEHLRTSSFRRQRALARSPSAAEHRFP
jgi:pilus assembly protein CpaF